MYINVIFLDTVYALLKNLLLLIEYTTVFVSQKTTLKIN